MERFYAFSFGGHHGTVKFKEGRLAKADSKLTGGTFTVDMNTIINTDGDYSEDLVKHLKNEDFFNVKQHPTAKLEITKVEYYDNGAISMNANLTIKGIKKPVTIEVENGETTNQLNTRFKIDRTDWNITYGSKGIVKIKDYAISDVIEFKVKLNF